jgi:glutathione S-transferase
MKTDTGMNTPVLYSYHRCPYCMRAHMALFNSGIKVELREVDINNMPEEAASISPKATVPILVFNDGTFIDESWDIVKWALAQNDPDNWLGKDNAYLLDAEMLVETNDFSFKEDLDHYKDSDHYPQQRDQDYRQACEEFLLELEDMLSDSQYLLSDAMSLADIGVFPFILQFSQVDKEWFVQSPYPRVQHWLNRIIGSSLFQHIFQKHKIWRPGDSPVYI